VVPSHYEDYRQHLAQHCERTEANIESSSGIEKSCLKGHHLDEEDFIETVARLKNPVRRRSIVIIVDYMLSNLTLWLLYHYDGTFLVVVDAKTIYKKVQGQSKNEIELRVKSKCGTDRACQEGKNSFRMTENVAGSFRDFFSSTSKTTPSAGCEPSGRKELYSWEDWKVPGLNSINSHIRKVAWNLTWWLCGLRVEPSRSESNGIVYQINLCQREADERPTSLETLLQRSPKIL
jgi:hypothetical protein